MMALEIVMTQMKTTGKKVSIIRNRKRQSEEVFQQLRYKLRKIIFILTEKHPDIVISIGGDGMLLSAFRQVWTPVWIEYDLLAFILDT